MKRLTSRGRPLAALAVATLAAAWCVAAGAQATKQAEPLHFSSAEGSVVEVDGDSTMHKWTVRGRQIDGTIDFQVDLPDTATAEQIVDAIVRNPRVAAKASVPATTLKSTKQDKTMDAKMYGALNVKNHPRLSYALAEVTGVRRESPTRLAADGRSTSSHTTVPPARP